MYKFSFQKDKYHLQEEIAEWCKENVGHGKWIPYYSAGTEWAIQSDLQWMIVLYSLGRIDYWFRDEHDAFKFKMSYL